MPPQRKQADYDQTLKRLLTSAHDAFLRLVAPEVHWRRERSPELAAVRRQADLVWEVEHPTGGRGLIHIELQVKVDRTMRQRLLEYNVRLMQRDQLPVRSVVVFLRPARGVPQSPLLVPWGGTENLRFTFDVVRLWQIPREQVLGTDDPALWPLASLMAGATPAVIAEVASRIERAALPRAEQGELIGILATLAGVRFARDVVAEAIRSNPMIREILHESSFAALLRDEGRVQGKEEGRVQGKEEGRVQGKEEGRVEGERKLAQVALEGRFGPLTTDLVTALQTADEATLLAVVAHVSSDTLEQIRGRLGLS